MIEMPTESEPVKVIHGDCLDVMGRLPAGCIDSVVTSPPYNMGSSPWPHLGNWKPGDSAGGKSKWKNGSDASNGIQYSAHKDTMPWPDYVAWQKEVIAELWRLISDKGAIFYNHKPRTIGAKLWTPQELLPNCVVLRQIVIWSRPGGMNFNPTAFVPTYEWVMILAKPAWRLKSKAASGLGNVWKISPDQNDHPAPFPIELARRCIEPTNASIILDPFAGSGTTGIASIMEKRRCILIEKDEKYVEMTRRRIHGPVQKQGNLFEAIA